MQSVLGIAKNVNGRRAATAYHLLPGAPSSNSSSVTNEPSPSPSLAYVGSAFDALPMLKSASAASLASSFSSSSLSGAEPSPSAPSSNSSTSSRGITPAHGSTTDLVRLHSSPFLLVQRSADDTDNDKSAAAVDAHKHLHKHGSVVDKTNPFIGYFQTGHDATAAAAAVTTTTARESTSIATASGLPPRAATTSVIASSNPTTPYAALLHQPKRIIADWINSQSTRLPSLFTKCTDALESVCIPPQLQQPQQPQQLQQPSSSSNSSNDTKHLSLLHSLQAAASSLRTSARQDTAPSQQLQQSTDALATAAVVPIAASASSRFAQDFVVLASLGKGGQGAVFKVRSTVDGCVYAIKQVELATTALENTTELEQARREAVAMAAIPPHPNVVRYHTAWIEVESLERNGGSAPSSTTTSTASGRKSDVRPNDSDSSQSSSGLRCVGAAATAGRDRDATADDDADDDFTTFSLGSIDSMSTSTYDQSFSGFEFEPQSQSMTSMHESDDNAVSDPAASSLSLTLSSSSKSRKAKLTMYIQMELCSTTLMEQQAQAQAQQQVRSAIADEPFDQFVDRLQRPPVASASARHANLTQWLRATVAARSSRALDHTATHAEGLALFLGAAMGVRHMHAAGVIHRDLKPDNIFLDGATNAKVGDFGLSKSIYTDSMSPPTTTTSPLSFVDNGDSSSDGDRDHTTALGTFTYASPEQLGHRCRSVVVQSTPAASATRRRQRTGSSATYSIQSDIFALGVILLELCCPFSTMMERSQVLTAVRHGVVPHAARVRFPTEMALVVRMTAADPNERPSAAEVCDHIRALLLTTARQTNTHNGNSSSSLTTTTRSALEDFRDLQSKLALAVHQLRDRSQTSTLQLEALVTEMSDKLQLYGAALA